MDKWGKKRDKWENGEMEGKRKPAASVLPFRRLPFVSSLVRRLPFSPLPLFLFSYWHAPFRIRHDHRRRHISGHIQHCP